MVCYRLNDYRDPWQGLLSAALGDLANLMLKKVHCLLEERQRIIFRVWSPRLVAKVLVGRYRYGLDPDELLPILDDIFSSSRSLVVCR